MSTSITTHNFFDSALQERQAIVTSLMSAAIAKGKLAHAYLFTGRTVDDKWLVARQMAAALNCRHKDKDASDLSQTCLAKKLPGESFCQNCKWISNGEHPQAFLT